MFLETLLLSNWLVVNLNPNMRNFGIRVPYKKIFFINKIDFVFFRVLWFHQPIKMAATISEILFKVVLITNNISLLT